MVPLLLASLLSGTPMPVLTTGDAVDAQLKENRERVTVEGTLERVSMGKGSKTWLGTALVLDDGKVVWLTYAAPPAGWEVLLGKFLRVEGVLARQSSATAQSLVAPHLLSPGKPAEVARTLASLEGRPVRLAGVAENAKGGAVLLVNDEPVYVARRDSWPLGLTKQRISLGGRLVRKQYLPEATVNAKGEISQGTAAGSTQHVLENASEPTPLEAP
jgi:hypothetical protein